MQRELNYRLRQQSLLSDLGVFALKCRDLDVLFQEACRLCALGLDTGLAKVLEYLPDQKRLLVRAGIGWHPGVVGHATIGADLESPAGFALSTGMPVIANRLAGEERFRTPQLLLDHGVVCAINVLIGHGGEHFGVLEADSSTQHEFTGHDIAFMTGMANLLSVAIERERNTRALAEAVMEKDDLLSQKDLLLREVNHRVRNSLQLIISLLRIQAQRIEDDDLRHSFASATDRISAVARIHDRLTHTDDVTTVEFGAYLRQICLDIVEAGGQRCRLAIQPMRLPTDAAISLALIAVEMLTNAIKHGRAGDADQTVDISFSHLGDGEARLDVRDYGAGLPPGFRLGEHQDSGLGITLMTALARRIGGTLWAENAGPGARWSVALPPQPPAQQR
ncbi:MAG TPA: histidine kinase dimerization/phosphoacceptor domain -containing protein [Stellaceae bacterium]|nr:histidine kinase dimerization/phosphoacceptor domain -containing protein [Stellaceae bacterium]